MNFTTSDVARLYGTRLFRIPRAGGAAGSASPSLSGAEATASATDTAPTGASAAPPLPHPARLTLLLRTGDLAAPALRELLSKIVQAVGLELSECNQIELDAAPIAAPSDSPATLSFGWLVPGSIELPSLSALAADTALKRAAWERLKPLKGTL